MSRDVVLCKNLERAPTEITFVSGAVTSHSPKVFDKGSQGLEWVRSNARLHAQESVCQE